MRILSLRGVLKSALYSFHFLFDFLFAGCSKSNHASQSKKKNEFCVFVTYLLLAQGTHVARVEGVEDAIFVLNILIHFLCIQKRHQFGALDGVFSAGTGLFE
jgi:hypothetical protein